MPSGKGGAYQRIADDLLARIDSGELGPGDLLPSISELMAQYNVSKSTVASAMDVLRASGVVVTRQGTSARVREFRTIRRSSPARLSRERWGAGQTIHDADTTDRVRVVDVVIEVGRAPEWVTEPLRLAPADEVLSRSRRFLVEDQPVQLAVSYYPADLVRATAIALVNSGPGGSYQRLAELDRAPTRFTEHLRGRMPTRPEMRDLLLPAGVPVLELTRHAYTADGQCVEVNRMVLDCSAYLLDYSFSA